MPERIIPADRDATTDDQLRALQNQGKFGGLQKKENEQKSHDVMENSTFIQIGDSFTLVPKGSVMDVPPKLAPLIVTAPKGKFVPWSEMQRLNRGTLAGFEVTLEQASGQEAVDASKFEIAKRSGCILVAVIKNGAISMAKP